VFVVGNYVMAFSSLGALHLIYNNQILKVADFISVSNCRPNYASLVEYAVSVFLIEQSIGCASETYTYTVNCGAV